MCNLFILFFVSFANSNTVVLLGRASSLIDLAEDALEALLESVTQGLWMNRNVDFHT